jgi:predicted RND superfamily exporter protein
MKKFSDFVIEKRVVILTITFLLTCFFAYHIRDLKVYTKFADLLPQGHEYIKLHNRIRAKFGGANTVVMILQVREGDIFNPTTLQKLKDITEDLFYIPSVDRFKIASIAMKKMGAFVFKSGAIEVAPLMWPDVPKTQEEIEELKEKVYGSFFYGGFVWFDSKKTFITADFFEDEIDYSVVYEALIKIQEKYEDDNNILSISGEPLRLGYVKSYVGAVMKIMVITLGVMLLFFLFYFRSIRGMLIPILAALVGGVWGMGFMALLDYNLDPLVLVFPFLIAARTAGHAVQVIKRYVEECGECNDNKEACKRAIRYLFRPGFTGIVTDAAGIMLIALTPLQILQKITFTCAFWSIATVVIALLLVPCILSYFPFPHKSVERLKKKGVLDKGLTVIGGWIPQRGCRVVLLCFAVLLAGGAYLARDIRVGDAIPGSSLLWPWHRYNQDSFRIAFSMPMLSPLYVIMEGEEKDDLISCPDRPRRKCGDNLRDMRRFERFMRKTPGRLVMFTRSVVSSFGGGASFAHEGDPNWIFFPPTDKRLIAAYIGQKYRGEPGSMDMFVDEDNRSANIIIYCRDKMTPTIETVMARIKEYIDLHSRLDPPMKYKLAGGTFGVQAAINEVIEKYQVRTLAWTLLAIFLFCTVLFRSFMAGIILVVPLIVSNTVAFALMATGFLYALPTPITLTTSTLPVSAVGIGLGVDYGIYLLSRIMEEYKISRNLSGAITAAMTTTGKAVIYISTTLTIGILFWIFSPLMFQAVMGFFLAIILFFNMVGALLLVTSLVAVLKPKFITG